MPENVSIRPAGSDTRVADAYDLTFAGVRGATVYAKLLVPKGAAGAPALVVFHDYSQSSGDWLDLVSWASEGFVVAALDVRGRGGRSTDPAGLTGSTFAGQIVRGASDGPDALL